VQQAAYRRDVDDLERRLTDFYDREGATRLEAPLDVRRIAARDDFVARLHDECRQRLLEVGSGPGRDALAFTAAALDVTALDRSRGHLRLAVAQGLRCVQGSVLALPFPPHAFGAGWTMSTLVHVPDDRWDVAMGEITSVLEAGAPLGVGLWGGFDDERWMPGRDGMPARFFSLRSHDRARAMLARHGTVESFVTWADDRSDWEYQFAVLRCG
jgi:SAM-dependent methyltransferase